MATTAHKEGNKLSLKSNLKRGRVVGRIHSQLQSSSLVAQVGSLQSLLTIFLTLLNAITLGKGQGLEDFWSQLCLVKQKKHLITFGRLFSECILCLHRQNAEEALKEHGVEVIAHDAAWAEEKQMGSFLSVTRGSEEPPVFLEMKYKGGNSEDKPVVLVGE